ncbi:regulator of G-protein signaling 19 [Turdus rufiventris]|nr:regulator of G-protein signaling 19 [Turdus rufiventris]
MPGPLDMGSSILVFSWADAKFQDIQNFSKGSNILNTAVHALQEPLAVLVHKPWGEFSAPQPGEDLGTQELVALGLERTPSPSLRHFPIRQPLQGLALGQLVTAPWHPAPTSMGRNEDRERAWRASRETKLETIPNCEACAKPTPEEVQGWAQSFDKLMKSPAGRNVFREFLRTEYSEENMLFWLACEELKTECNKHTIDEKARMIYEDYISILSPKEVSLDSRVREVINRKMQEPSSHTFDDAQLQIYTLMHRDSYPRFLNSAIYKSLLQTVSHSSSES